MSVPTVQKLMESGQLSYFKAAAVQNGQVKIGIHNLLGYLLCVERIPFKCYRIDIDDFCLIDGGEFAINDKGLQLVSDGKIHKKKKSA